MTKHKKMKRYQGGGTTKEKPGQGVADVLGQVGGAVGAFNPVLGAALGIGSAVLPEILGAFAKPSQYTPIRNNTRAFRNGGDTQLSNDTILVQGNPSITDGNIRTTPSGVTGRFDHDELITQLPDREFALSPNLINPLTGNMLAQDGKKIKKAQGKAEKKDTPEALTTQKLLQQRFNTLVNENIRQLNQMQQVTTGVNIPKNIRPFTPLSTEISSEQRQQLFAPSNKMKDSLTKSSADKLYERKYGGTMKKFQGGGTTTIEPEERFLFNSDSTRFIDLARPSNRNPLDPNNSITTQFMGNSAMQNGLESITFPGPKELQFNEAARPVLFPFEQNTSVSNSFQFEDDQINDNTGVDNLLQFNQTSPNTPSRNTPSPKRKRTSAPVSDAALPDATEEAENQRILDFANFRIADRTTFPSGRLPSLGANVQTKDGLVPKPPLAPDLTKDPSVDDQQDDNLGLGNIPIGELLQIPGVLARFKGINQVEKESANLLPNRQIDFTPINRRLRSNFNANLANINSSSSNVNRALRQQAFADLNRATTNSLSQVSNQNANLTQQTRRANIAEINRVAQINAQNRAAQDQARLAAFDSIGNVGRGINKKRTNRKAVEAISQSFPDIAKFLLNALNIRTNGNE